MALNIEDITSLFLDLNGNGTLSNLVMEYVTLKQKVDNPDDQSWYFKKGIQSKKQKLRSLEASYEKTREFFNDSSVDCLIEKMNDYQQRIPEMERSQMNILTRLYYFHLVAERAYKKELIHLKSKTETLQPIDYYLDKPEALLKIVG